MVTQPLHTSSLPMVLCRVRGLPETENLHFTFSRRTRTTTLLYCLCPEFPAASFSAPAALQSFSSPLPASRVPWPRVLQRITANFSVLDTTSAKTNSPWGRLLCMSCMLRHAKILIAGRRHLRDDRASPAPPSLPAPSSPAASAPLPPSVSLPHQ